MERVIKLLIVLFVTFNLSFAKEIEGVNIPDTLTELRLNGAGVRNKFFLGKLCFIEYFYGNIKKILSIGLASFLGI